MIIEAIEILFKIITPITIIAFIIFFIIAFSIKIQMWREDFFEELKNFKIGLPSMIITIFGFISIFTLNSLENNFARNEIKEFLLNKDCIIQVEGKKTNSLNGALRAISKTSDNRNTGTREIKIEIKSKKEKLSIRLQRSFIENTKYWVYLENHPSTSKNCIGEINTNQLDNY